MAKAYFIGLGGCGLKTVSELYRRLHAEDPSGTDYQFTFIDTDDKTKSKINADNGQIVIRDEDFVNLGPTNPYKVYANAQTSQDPNAERLKEWAIPSGPGRLTFPNQQLADGAQAVRMFGRMGTYHYNAIIKTNIKSKLGTFQDLRDNDGRPVNPDIWVFASSCGGTGSSLTLDVLYFINRIVIDSLHLAEPDVKLVLFMPKPFIDKNPGNNQYYYNAFAYMWELNAFRLSADNHENDQYGVFAAVPKEQTWTDNIFSPYKYVIPVDVESDHNNKIDLEALYPTVAEMVYFLNKGNVNNSMISNMSNDQRLLSGEIYKHDDTICKWSTSLIAYGYRAVRKANKELEDYLQRRGMYELLKYGLLGEDVPEESRDEAKTEFAKEYILPWLTSIEGVSPKPRSLTTLLSEVYAGIYPPKPEDLNANRVTNFLQSVESVKEGQEVANVRKEVLEEIKSSINTGVSKVIRQHGLVYAKTLLNLVDDFYLEKIRDEKLVNTLKSKEQEVNAIKSECESYLSKLNKKTFAICVAACARYRDAVAEYQVLTESIELINALTDYPKGYLEVLRKGTTDKVGLQRLINKTNSALSVWESKYDNLAKEFMATTNNAFTTYLPNLSSVACGNNNHWPYDTLFDRIYCNSVLDYDHNLAYKNDGERRPVHIANGSQNCISFYFDSIDEDNTLFTNLALMDEIKLSDRFESQIILKLQKVLATAINREGSQSARWLSISLEEALQNQDFLPEGESIGIFTNRLSAKDNIHVLYPTTSQNAVSCRYIYASASESLATQFGYQSSPDTQFVRDPQMTDRLLMIKMPIGLDFYSYSHFSSIQSMYMNNRESIKALSDKAGAHLHRAFVSLDLNKAKESVLKPKRIAAFKLLIEALYWQEMVNLFKVKVKNAYEELFGGTIDFGVQSAQNEDFLDLGIDFGQGGEIIVIDDQTIDQFIEVSYDRESKQLVINLSPVSIDSNKLVQIDVEKQERCVFGAQDLCNTTLFINKLNQPQNIKRLRDIHDTFDRLVLENTNIKNALISSQVSVKNAVLTQQQDNKIKFAAFIGKWQANPDNAEYIRALSETLKNLHI